MRGRGERESGRGREVERGEEGEEDGKKDSVRARGRERGEEEEGKRKGGSREGLFSFEIRFIYLFYAIEFSSLNIVVLVEYFSFTFN